MSKYDYLNAFVNKKDKKRYNFYVELAAILEMYESVNQDVNELIGWMSVLTERYTKLPESCITKGDSDYLKPDEKIDKYTYIRNITPSDYRLHAIISSIIECAPWNKEEKDALSEVTQLLYNLLDKIVHPYHRKNLDLEDVRYYIECEYINEEIIKQNKDIKYDSTEI